MALQTFNWANLPIQESPYGNLIENIFKGYQIGRAPEQMNEEQLKRQLANKLSQMEVEHKPTEYALSDQQKRLAAAIQSEALKYLPKQRALDEEYKRAQIQNLLNPKEPTSALAQAFKLRSQLDPTSKTYDEDYRMVTDYMNNLGRKGSGLQVTTTPEGGVQVSFGGDEQQTGNIPGLPPLKKGEAYVFDDNKNPIGVAKPLSAPEAKEEKGRLFFNTVYPFLNSATAPYNGKGALLQFKNDVLNYESDPEAKQRIDNYYAARKLLTAGTVKENATIGGNSTNQQLKQLKKSVDNSEIPPLAEWGSSFRLPQGYLYTAGEIFNQKLNEATEASHNTPAFRVHPINPNKKEEKKEKSKQGKVYNIVTRQWEDE